MLGRIVVDVNGLELSAEDREILNHPLVGGVILFTRNFEEPEQLSRLICQIRNVKSPALVIAVDQEGGSVQRFRKYFSRLPSLSAIGSKYETNPEWARTLARDHAWVMANELLSVGVDFSFAPVVDLKDSKSSVIGDRAFHRRSEVVSELASIYVETLKGCGMSAVAKHFPGHGLVEEDSHISLPTDLRSLRHIMDNDVLPYRKCIDEGLEGIMMAHVLYPEADDKAAGYSEFWIREIIKKNIGFEGVVFSDDLNMGGAAISGSYAERAVMACSAGCDVLLVCNNRNAVEVILEDRVWELEELSQTSKLEKMRVISRHRDLGSAAYKSRLLRAKNNLEAID